MLFSSYFPPAAVQLLGSRSASGLAIMIVKAAQIWGGNEMLKRACGCNWRTCHHCKFGSIFGQGCWKTHTLPASSPVALYMCVFRWLHYTPRRHPDYEWKPDKFGVLFDRQTEMRQSYESWHAVVFRERLTGMMRHWFSVQVADVTNREMREVTARHHTFIWKMPDSPPPPTTFGVGEKFVWLFIFVLPKLSQRY